MKRVESLWSVFGNCFLEPWKFFCPLSKWTTLWKTLKAENWWYWKHSLTKSAYFNFSKNICVSSNIPTVLFFFFKAIQFGGNIMTICFFMPKKAFHWPLSCFWLSFSSCYIRYNHAKLRFVIPSNLVCNSQCYSLYENIYRLKLRLKWRLHKWGTRLILLRRLDYKQT